MYQARSFLLLLTERGLLHSEQVADVIEVVRLAVLLPDLLFDKLIPIIHGEGFGRYHHFVPMRFDVVLLRRLRYVQSVELHSSRDLLFTFENGQRYLKKFTFHICVRVCLRLISDIFI